MSTIAALVYKQRLMNYVLLALLGGGTLAVVASLAGIGAPPRAALPVASFNSLNALSTQEADSPMRRLRAGSLPLPPFTVEAQGRPVGPDAEWGLWISSSEETIDFLIDNEGYFFIGPNDWQPFIHLRAGLNRFYLHVDEDARATLRLNGEIAWQGQLAPDAGAAWGVAIRQSVALQQFELALWAD